MSRNGRYRLLASAAIGATLVAGVAATATPAAAARPADPSHGNNNGAGGWINSAGTLIGTGFGTMRSIF